jgi:hypothetical protein
MNLKRDRRFEDGFNMARDIAAKLVSDFALNYPEDVFTPPKPGSPPDCYSAAMARHVCKVLNKEIKELKHRGYK